MAGAVEPGLAGDEEDTRPVDLIKARLATLVAMRVERRRRVQLPLFAFSALTIVSGAIIYVSGALAPLAFPIFFEWGQVLMLAGGLAIVLSAMPGDVPLLRGILTALFFVAGFAAATMVQPMLAVAQRITAARGADVHSPGDRGYTPVARVTLWLLAFGVSGLIVCGVAAMAASLALLAGSCNGRVSPLRMTTLTLKVYSATCISISVPFVIHAVRAAIDPSRQYRLDSFVTRTELVSVYSVLFVQAAGMGLTSLLNKNLRSHVHAYLAGRGVGVSAAAGIAALLSDVSATDVLRDASASFRAVSLDDLTYEMLVPLSRVEKPAVQRPPQSTTGPRIRLARSSSDEYRILAASKDDRLTPAVDTPAELRGTVARAAELGQVDAFVSHSWHDPADVKWRALQAWGDTFRVEHGRAPLLWIDSLCIDQSNISAQLPSLPVYLTGCKTLLVLHGPTYLSRLWCVVELFVFFQAHLPAPPEDKITLITLDMPWTFCDGEPSRWRSLQATFDVVRALERRKHAVSPTISSEAMMDSASLARIAAIADAKAFDVRNAHAALPEDEENLLAVIETSGEAIEHFTRWFTQLVVSQHQHGGAAALKQSIGRSRAASHQARSSGTVSARVSAAEEQ